MRDNGEKSSSSNHRGNHHHSSSSNSAGKNNTAGLFADIKAESTRGLELLDKIVNDAAQVKWILKNVLTSVAEIESSNKPSSSSCVKCQNCTTTERRKEQSQSTGSPAKEKRDKKAKKAVLPMVSGHTVQRPSINITRVDVLARQREGSSNSNDNAPVAVPSRRPGPKSSKNRPVVAKRARERESEAEEDAESRRGRKERKSREGGGGERRKSSSSSSSSERSRQRSSSSSSSSSSASGTTSASASSSGSDVLSVGGRTGKDKKKASRKNSPSRKQYQSQQAKKSQPQVAQQRAAPSQLPHHGSASSRFLSSSHHVNEMKKKHIQKNVRVRVKDVSRLVGFRKTVRLSDLDEADVRVYWSAWRKPNRSPQQQQRSSSVHTEPECKPQVATPPKKPTPRIGPKSKMLAARPASEKPHVTTTAEALRAKLREKFNKFKMTKLGSGGNESAAALPDSTTNSNGSVAEGGKNTENRAKSTEMDAIGLSVIVTAAERKQHESVDEFVGKAMMEGGARSELLEMKRDDWILMQNNKTGISSLRDDVNKGLKRVVGFGHEEDGVREEYDDGHYLVGNFYFIAREDHPLALMRYIGSNTLPPCDSNDKDAPPRGFMPVDLSSLSQSQISQLEELGSANKKAGRRRSSSSNNTVKLDEDEDDEPIEVPTVDFDEDDDSDSDY